MAREMLAKLMGELNLQTGGASTDLLVSSTQHDQIDPPGRIGFGLDRAALNGSPQEQRVLPAATDAALTAKRSTILPDDYSLERSISEFDSAGGQRDVAPSHPKKRMGGNALKAMG
jgi:hypothetical protein